jgi:hypothetical protein
MPTYAFSGIRSGAPEIMHLFSSLNYLVSIQFRLQLLSFSMISLSSVWEPKFKVCQIILTEPHQDSQPQVLSLNVHVAGFIRAHVLRPVFRIRIRLIRIRIQPIISIRIRIPDPDPGSGSQIPDPGLVKFIEIIIFSFS